MREQKELDIITNISHKFITDDLTLTKEEAKDYFSIDGDNCTKWNDDSGYYMNIKGLATFKIDNDNKENENLFKSSM